MNDMLRRLQEDNSERVLDELALEVKRKHDLDLFLKALALLKGVETGVKGKPYYFMGRSFPSLYLLYNVPKKVDSEVDFNLTSEYIDGDKKIKISMLPFKEDETYKYYKKEIRFKGITYGLKLNKKGAWNTSIFYEMLVENSEGEEEICYFGVNRYLSILEKQIGINLIDFKEK